MDCPYAIIFLNNSSTTFALNYTGDSLGDGFDSMTIEPGTTLAPNDKQIMALAGPSGDVVGDSQFYLTWYDATTGIRLGVLLHIPVQVGGIGKRPYWYVSLDQESDPTVAPTWNESGDDPSDAYTWPLPTGSFVASANPDSYHSDLQILVTISNPS